MAPNSRLGYTEPLRKSLPIGRKGTVFSFEKLTDVDTQLGPEMKSTGEVLELGKNLREALYKGLVAAGYTMRKKGGVFITVRDTDKAEIPEVAKKYAGMGFSVYSTAGTGEVLKKSGIAVTTVANSRDRRGKRNLTSESGKINYKISTSAKGRDPSRDKRKVRRKACCWAFHSKPASIRQTRWRTVS